MADVTERWKIALYVYDVAVAGFWWWLLRRGRRQRMERETMVQVTINIDPRYTAAHGVLDHATFCQCEACSRAERLLLSHLTPSQAREWDSKGLFRVRGSLGSDYQIRRSFANNIVLEGHRSYCVWHGRKYPLCDTILAQKLLIENDELAMIQLSP